QVLRPSGVASRFEALRGSALTPLVGRYEEIEVLLRRWARAKVGHGQVVLISGEPGFGKSRITAELEQRLYAEPHIQLRYFCSPELEQPLHAHPYFNLCFFGSPSPQDSALFPFIAQLTGAAVFAPADPPVSKLKKFEALLARRPLPQEDVAFLAELLSLPSSE